MGKVLIIKGADFSENSISDYYVLPPTTLDGETNIITNIHLMGNENTKWIMKVKAIKNYPPEKIVGYAMSFGGHFNGSYQRVGFGIMGNNKNSVFTMTGITGIEEPQVTKNYELDSGINSLYLRRLNNVISYSTDNANWVDIYTISNITEPEKNDCYLCFGNYTPPTDQKPENYFIGTVQAKVCFNVSNASFNF